MEEIPQQIPIESLLWLGVVLLLIVGIPALLLYVVYSALFADKKGMSSRQAAEYWREKFRDETAAQLQRETLLRASRGTETPDVLLRPAHEETQQMPSQQLLCPARGPKTL